jgi:peptide/nickel transport system substrate-binding protein
MPGTWAHYDGLQITAYDSIEAIEKLKEAGYLLTDENDTTRKKDDVSLTLELVHPDTELHQLIAESIQSNWSELGIEVSLVPLPYEELVNLRLEPRSYQAALIDLNFTKSPDPDPYPFWNQAQATGGQNYSQWNNRVASEYLEQARINAELTERTRLYRNFQIVFNDELPSLPLYYPVYSYAVDREVQGVQIGPLFDTSDRFNSIHSWYLIARIPTPQVIE